MKKLFIALCALVIMSASCTSFAKNKTETTENFDSNTAYGVLMGNTVLEEYPEIWTIEDRNEPKWSYTYGLLSMAMLELYEKTGTEAYYRYAKGYADTLIDGTGHIKTYKKEDYNIDHINSGRILFTLYEKTGDQKYKRAIDTLRSQLTLHPQTEIGGFWHKKRYPHQMWLDGVYMGAPFYAQYAQQYNEPDKFDEIAAWIMNVEKVTRDPETGLLYHAWDESKQQAWADKETGCSPHFWGRAMGWYSMGLVDVLDYFPKQHEKYDSIVAIIQRLAEAIVKYQDEETGVWYQVLDQGTREGNYLEGSVSSMFSYFLLKSINNGYINSDTYMDNAKMAYRGTINNLMVVDADSTLTLTPVCAVAGLGGSPYRDGSYEYYVNEQLRDNDPKAVGPFILAALEYDKLTR
ncbi:MAG: glycoside hydrolase family 88/105 protein [Bacteroidota bacterium]